MDKGAIILARRYARAYLDLFFDTLTITSYHSFERAADIFLKNARIGFLLDLSVMSKELKLKEIHRIVRACGLPESSGKIIALVVEHKRGSLLGEVFTQIADLYKRLAKIDECQVASSSVLSDQEKMSIERCLQQQTEATLSFEYRVNPNLIAGICCQTSTLRWEDSVDKKLRRLEQLLKR